MFSILTYGLSVALVGIAIVFCALVILIGLIKAMEKVLAGLTKKEGTSHPKAQPAAQDAAPAIVPATNSGSNDEIVAVITAAISAILAAEQNGVLTEETKGFVVRSIRRVSNAPAWNRAGREEQVYSRL